MDIKWNEKTKKDYEEITDNLPQFHRTIAKQLVKERAEELASQRDSKVVEEKDLIVAFFDEVPPAFKGMMERLLNQHNIDFSKYVDG